MSDVEKRIEQWREELAGSESLGGADVRELESHLREEMKCLKNAGLSADEVFLVARHRLGDAAALEEEFAKVNPHKRLTSRLSWMAAGVLGYFLILHLSVCAAKVSTLLGYVAGLRNLPLAVLACLVHTAAFVGIGVLLWRSLTHHLPLQATSRKLSPSLYVNIFAACAIVALWWIDYAWDVIIVERTIPILERGQFFQASGWASFGWLMVMPFLLVGLLTLLALRDRRSAASA